MSLRSPPEGDGVREMMRDGRERGGNAYGSMSRVLSGTFAGGIFAPRHSATHRRKTEDLTNEL